MKKLTVCLLLLSLVAVVAAQNAKPKPDLSGTWKLTEPKDDPSPGSRLLNTGDILVIAQHEPEVKVSSKFVTPGNEGVNELTYYTDGRGETNVKTGGNQPVATVTKWDGNKLVTKHVASMTVRGASGGEKTGKIETTQKWELSKDGQKLSLTATVTGPPEIPPFNVMTEPLKMKYVYVREP